MFTSSIKTSKNPKIPLILKSNRACHEIPPMEWYNSSS